MKQYCRYKNNKATRLYRIWTSMKQRCNNPNHMYFKHYGARGIKICEEWGNDFDEFYRWAYDNGYDDTMSIDRIDNNKGYEPSNCRLVYYKDQPKNRRTNHMITIYGEEMTVSDCSRKYHIPISTIIFRERQGTDIFTERRKQSVICVETGEEYKSVSEASKATGINRGNISRSLHSPNLKAGGYHWKQKLI